LLFPITRDVGDSGDHGDLLPPGLFFSQIQNKALARFDPCETQA
jgi:hypothetical protein